MFIYQSESGEKMSFNNNASEVGFIGNRRLEEVILLDKMELGKVGGSFIAIAARMKYFQSFHFTEEGEREYEMGLLPIPERLFYTASKSSTSIIFDFRKEYTTSKGLIERKYRVWNYAYTNGLQECPFFGCGARGQRDVLVANMMTNRVLIVNDITIHLVKKHSLLEKDNRYGISVKDFYEEFM